jgi:hypothetical protein
MPFRVVAGLAFAATLCFAVSGQDEPRGSGPEIVVKLGNPFALRYAVAVESLVDYRVRSEAAERTEEQVRLIVKEEFAQVTVDGRTEIRCNRRSIESGRGGPVNTAEAGRTFEIMGAGKERRVRAADGKEVDPAFADHLGRWTDLLALVPGKAVRPGETWKVEVSNLDKSLTLGRPVAGLSFECELQGVRDGVATITYKASQKKEGKTESQEELEEEWSLDLGLSGFVQIDTTAGRPKEVQVRGRFSLATKLFKNERDLESRVPVRKEIGRITVEADRVISTVKFSYPE